MCLYLWGVKNGLQRFGGSQEQKAQVSPRWVTPLVMLLADAAADGDNVNAQTQRDVHYYSECELMVRLLIRVNRIRGCTNVVAAPFRRLICLMRATRLFGMRPDGSDLVRRVQ